MEFKDLPKARRQKIMDAAMEEFAAHDYRGANTETIAARGGISKGLLFYYFKNKKIPLPHAGAPRGRGGGAGHAAGTRPAGHRSV